jgi:hypothetical protein
MKQFNLETQSWEDDEGERTLGSLEFLQAIYRDTQAPLSVRMRAAIEALPFESPKLSATAIVQGQDFAALLDARLKRIEVAKLKVVDAEPGASVPTAPDRRSALGG